MSKIINQSEISGNYVLPDTSIVQMNVKSNESATENMTTSFIKTREANLDFCYVNDEITQTITLKNDSELTIENINVKDTLSAGLSFKPTTVTINNVAKTSLDPTVGFNLESDIGPNETVTISYTSIAGDSLEEDLEAISEITYSVNEIVDLKEQTNMTVIPLVNNKISIDLSCDPAVAIKGQTVTYTNVISNEGNYKNSEVVFTNDLPEGLSFVEGSLTIDGAPQQDADPTTGVQLNDLLAGDEITVVFEAEIN